VRCSFNVVREGWPHKGLRLIIDATELNPSPVRRIATRQTCFRAALQRARAAAHTYAHHRPAGLTLSTRATTLDRNVLPDALASFGVVDLLRVVASGIAHDVRALAQRSTHTALAELLGQCAQLANDRIESFDLELEVRHYR